MTLTEPIALIKAACYSDPRLIEKIGNILDASLTVKSGQTVLVKPNLLMDLPLACTAPELIRGACCWLMDHGCRVRIGDSPAFGTAKSVARAIGLTEILQPLGLATENFQNSTRIRLSSAPNSPAINIATAAMECDLILSVPRIKAHSQMRLTLAVKNCFGCVTGLRKALAHMEFGRTTDYFADMIVAVFQALPPVAALYDGITAMSVTGPRKGEPFKLGLLAASQSATAGDQAIIQLLNLAPEHIPICRALSRKGIRPQPVYCIQSPDDFNPDGFKVPDTLKPVSFNPLRLAASLLKRAVLNIKSPWQS